MIDNEQKKKFDFEVCISIFKHLFEHFHYLRVLLAAGSSRLGAALAFCRGLSGLNRNNLRKNQPKMKQVVA